MRTDKEIMDDLSKAVASLNSVLDECNKVGIAIDATVDSYTTFGDAVKRVRINVVGSRIINTNFINYITYTGAN